MSNVTLNLDKTKKIFSSKEKTQGYIDNQKDKQFHLPKKYNDAFSHVLIEGMDVYKTQKQDQAIVYIPGGGFIAHPSDYQIGFAKNMSEETKQTVYMLIYPKTPTHSRDDIVLSVKKVLHTLCQEYKGVSIVSDSAGSAIMMSAMNDLDALIHKVVYLSPLVDLRYDSEEIKQLAQTDEMLALPGVKMLAHLYKGPYELSDSEISPILLKKIRNTKALIIVGKKEMTLHDARLLKEKYDKLQIEHQYYAVDDMPHDFMFYPMKEGKKYREIIFNFLQK